MQVYAVVDSEYRVLWVGGEWDEFALNGGANSATSNAVLSTSMMSHIAGSETRAATARMVDAVLQHKRTLRLEYRCDSPNVARKFQMTIQPMKDGRALMVHDLRDAWHFSTPLNRWKYDAAATDVKCSFCGDVRLAGDAGWTSCDDIGDRHPTHVNYQVCATCVGSIDSAVEDVLMGTVFSAALDEDKLPR